MLKALVNMYTTSPSSFLNTKTSFFNIFAKVLSGGDLQGEVEAESHEVDMVSRLLDMKEERLQPTANRKWNNQLQKGKTFFVLISFVLF